MKIFLKYLFLLLLFVPILWIAGCRKDRIITDPSAKLDFSNDTIIFDTLFTTVGSTTQQLKIYNNNKSKIIISSIYIAGAAGDDYRMNVDGVPGREFSDIEIEAGDSLYIFVEATIDPNSSTTPMLVTDSIIFITNGNLQHVDLVAWGQDAYFHTPPSGSGSPFFSLPCNDTWLNDKPHVIYGFPVVDSACNLTIQAGTKVYSHPNSGLIVYNSGTLIANGSPGNKIEFKGDRFEPDYDSLPGQWSGLIFLEAGQSQMEYCDIRNASVGVRVETVNGNLSPLVMNQVRIQSMSAFGLWNNKAGIISMTNCIISDCGQYSFVCTGGGDLFMNHCTFVNNWSYEDRSTPLFGMANYYEDLNDGFTYLVDLKIKVNNCIIYGTEDNEFAYNFNVGALADYELVNCFIKSDQNLSDPLHFDNISQNVNPVFVDPAVLNYKLQISSPCIGAANSNYRVPNDIDNSPRDASPDVGCYEYQ